MKFNSSPPTILFPIETIARELDAHLILAAALTKLGYRSVIGHKEIVSSIARLSRRVVWVGKDAFSLKLSPTSNEHVADYLNARESALVFIQDEGGIFPGNVWRKFVLEKHRADYLRTRNVSRVCVWGQRQGDLLSDYGIDARVIKITGCPRLDLCHLDYDWMQNNKIIERHSLTSPFILMCTRFGSVMHFKGVHKYFLSFSDEGRSSEWLNDRFGAWQRDAHDLADFVMLVKEVASTFENYQIVLRPHPSEDLMFYAQVFAPYKNILVTRDGSSLDWIRSAELVVHCNCTTGVEAILAKKPVINFLPNAIPRDSMDKLVAKEAGAVMRSVTSAIDRIGEILSGDYQEVTWSLEAKSILSNLTRKSIPMVVEQIQSVVEFNNICESEVNMPPKSMRKLLTQIILRRGNTDLVSDGYLASKRPSLDIQHVSAMIENCRQRGIGPARLGVTAPNYFVVDPL